MLKKIVDFCVMFFKNFYSFFKRLLEKVLVKRLKSSLKFMFEVK